MALGLQVLHTALQDLFQRDTSQILRGEWWRIGTALFFQDGGLAGGATNIAALLCIGGLAEQRLRRSVWIGAYLAGGLITECIALSWQPVGAGNSIGSCALAGALIGTLLLGDAGRPAKVFGIAAGAAAVLLVAMRDIHGAAALVGAALRLGFLLPRRS